GRTSALCGDPFLSVTKEKLKWRIAITSFISFKAYEVLCLLEMGRRARIVRLFAFGLRAGVFHGLSRCSVVGNPLHGNPLLDQRLMEYQRDLSQFPAQPVFRVATAKSSVWSCRIALSWFFSDFLQIRSSPSSYGQ